MHYNTHIPLKIGRLLPRFRDQSLILFVVAGKRVTIIIFETRAVKRLQVLRFLFTSVRGQRFVKV